MLGRMAELRPCSGRTEVQEPISTDRSGEDAEFTSLRSVNINMCNSIDVQFVPNSTTRTRPDQTRPDKVRGLCRKPARTRRPRSPTKIFGSAQRNFDISKFVDMLKRFAVITTVSPGGLQPCARVFIRIVSSSQPREQQSTALPLTPYYTVVPGARKLFCSLASATLYSRVQLRGTQYITVDEVLRDEYCKQLH